MSGSDLSCWFCMFVLFMIQCWFNKLFIRRGYDQMSRFHLVDYSRICAQQKASVRGPFIELSCWLVAQHEPPVVVESNPSTTNLAWQNVHPLAACFHSCLPTTWNFYFNYEKHFTCTAAGRPSDLSVSGPKRPKMSVKWRLRSHRVW